MRRLAFALLFAFPLFAYDIRSPRYALSVDIVMDRYDVRVTDVAAKSVIVAEKISRIDFEADEIFEAGDRKLHLRLHEGPDRLIAELSVQRKKEVLDSLHATWLLEPYTLQMHEGPYRVGGQVRAPVLIKRIEPIYTEAARVARVAGVVIVETVIDREGSVIDARVLKPLPYGLNQRAIEAVQQWKFQPGTLEGEPVDVIFNVTVSFKLDD